MVYSLRVRVNDGGRKGGSSIVREAKDLSEVLLIELPKEQVTQETPIVVIGWCHNLNRSPSINIVNLRDCKLSYRVALAS